VQQSTQSCSKAVNRGGHVLPQHAQSGRPVRHSPAFRMQERAGAGVAPAPQGVLARCWTSSDDAQKTALKAAAAAALNTPTLTIASICAAGQAAWARAHKRPCSRAPYAVTHAKRRVETGQGASRPEAAGPGASATVITCRQTSGWTKAQAGPRARCRAHPRRPSSRTPGRTRPPAAAAAAGRAPTWR